MEGMKKNYRSASDIEEEFKNVDFGKLLDFDDDGRYEFARCEGCDGPLFGYWISRSLKVCIHLRDRIVKWKA